MVCLHIPELSYTRFSRRLHEKTAGRRLPLCGSIEITGRCNLGCGHCYINRPGAPATGRELSGAELRHLIDQAAGAGCLWLLFTGGEPLIRPDFPEIYLHAKKRGLLLTLFTNGTAVTPEIADLLADWRPFAVEVSIYGGSRRTCDRITGVPGSFDRCLRGIELLLARRLPLQLKTMALTLNRHEIPAMQELAARLGVDFRFDPIVNAGLDGDDAPARLRLEPEEVVALDMADERRRREWLEFHRRFLGPTADPGRLFSCGAGRHLFHIDAAGRLAPCLLARQRTFDLKRGTFRQGWEEFLPRIIEQPWTAEEPCRYCELASLCGQCPGFAHLEGGDPGERVKYLCRIAHLRAERLTVYNSGQGGD